MTSAALLVRDVKASVGDTVILNGVDLEVPFGEFHAIMGPNGSGKSTLCHVLTGKRDYEVEGSAELGGVELLDKTVTDRARLGLMQAFQYPVEVAGVGLREFLEEIADERSIPHQQLAARLIADASDFGMEPFLDRAVNVDLSGGEKKRSEIFQMAVLAPRVAILDEIDSGLDIDAVREVAEAVETMRNPDMAVVMITHYSRILRYLTPDRIHVMMNGRIVESGGPELAEELEDGGYEAVRQRLGIETPAAPTREKAASEYFTDTPFDL
jgi:Fe-S cluster assembly ATP-binding protein